MWHGGDRRGFEHGKVESVWVLLDLVSLLMCFDGGGGDVLWVWVFEVVVGLLVENGGWFVDGFVCVRDVIRWREERDWEEEKEIEKRKK